MEFNVLVIRGLSTYAEKNDGSFEYLTIMIPLIPKIDGISIREEFVNSKIPPKIRKKIGRGTVLKYLDNWWSFCINWTLIGDTKTVCDHLNTCNLDTNLLCEMMSNIMVIYLRGFEKTYKTLNHYTI